MHELRSLLPYLRPYRRAFLAGLALVVISNFFATLGPRFLQHGIDALRDGSGSTRCRSRWRSCWSSPWPAGSPATACANCSTAAAAALRPTCATSLYGHLQRMSAEFYDRYPTGDVMARTTNDLLAVRMVAGPALMYLVDTTIRALLIAPAMLAISPRLTLLALVPLLGLPVAMVSLGRVIHRRSQEIQAQFSELTSHAHENLSGVRVVRAYRQERAEIGAFPRAERHLSHPQPGPGAGAGRVLPAADPARRPERPGHSLRGRPAGHAGAVTVGEFVAFGVYLAMLVWPMIALGWAVNLVQRGAASMGRINQLFRERPAITSPPRRRPAAGAGAPGRSSSGTSGSAIPGARDAAGCCRTSRSRWSPAVARHRRRHRVRQVHAGGPDRPHLRPRPRRSAHRRSRPAPAVARGPAAGGRVRAAGNLPLRRDPATERAARRTRRRPPRAGGGGVAADRGAPRPAGRLRHDAG